MCVGATGGSGGVLCDHQNIKALSAGHKSRGFVSVPKCKELWLLFNLFTRGERAKVSSCVLTVCCYTGGLLVSTVKK